MHRPLTYLTTIGIVGMLYYFSLDLPQTGGKLGRTVLHQSSRLMVTVKESIPFFTMKMATWTTRSVLPGNFTYKDQSALLEEPLVRFFENGVSTWNIVESGLVGGSTEASARLMESIRLSGDVEVHRLDGYGNSTVLSTQLLDIDPNREIIETQDPVHMVTASITHAGQNVR